jgi:spore coat polysaccharide biosynthesis protein SpsF
MIAAIIQARMGSVRFPDKVMKIIVGKPMLWHQVNRLRKSKLIEKIIIATTDKTQDRIIIDFAKENNILYFAGSEEDVLDRFYYSAKKFKVETVVRITGDCPLIDPSIVDMIINFYLDNKNQYDIVHNGTTYPDGIVETEVFSFNILKKTWENAKLLSEREHVTSYIWKNPEMFRQATVENSKDLSYLRLVVDDEKDFKLVKIIFQNLYKEDGMFYLDDIMKFLNQNPELITLNSSTIRNEGYLKSISEDKILKYSK